MVDGVNKFVKNEMSAYFVDIYVYTFCIIFIHIVSPKSLHRIPVLYT